MADTIVHIVAIPSENIYWCTGERDITVNGQVYEGFSGAVAVGEMTASMLHPENGLVVAFGVDGNDPVEIDRFVNQIGHVPVRVSMVRLKR